MSLIIAQGEVKTIGSMIYGPPFKKWAYVSGITFNNQEGDYTIELQIYRRLAKGRKTLFKYYLDGGDHLYEDAEYTLNQGDYFWAKSSVPGTTFIIMGSESIENNNPS